MAVASPKEEKRIFDSKIIESYCKAKYGPGIRLGSIWKHQYDILIQVGLPEKLLIELRENRLSDLLDS